MTVITREEFRQRWLSNDNGGGLTWNDVADCAVAWGLARTPKTMRQKTVLHMVLEAAGVPKGEW